MNTESSHPVRPLALVGIAATIIIGAAVIGAATNAVNGRVSQTYFRVVLRWDDFTDVPTAAIAQGIFEGLALGVMFAFVFTLAIALASGARMTYAFAGRYLLVAVGIIIAAWCIGGLLAMGLANLSPDFYRRAFIGVPDDHGEMIRYAWVGGSILGIMFGGLLALAISATTAAMSWRRQTT